MASVADVDLEAIAMVEDFWFDPMAEHYEVDAAPLADVHLEATLDAGAIDVNLEAMLAMADHYGIESIDADGPRIELGVAVAIVPVSPYVCSLSC